MREEIKLMDGVKNRHHVMVGQLIESIQLKITPSM